MLINCVPYQDGRKLADIAVEDIDRFIPAARLRPALRDASDAELRQMQTRVRSARARRRGSPAKATSGPRWRSTATRCSS